MVDRVDSMDLNSEGFSAYNFLASVNVAKFGHSFSAASTTFPDTSAFLITYLDPDTLSLTYAYWPT
jgi:hypothetical protein